MNYKYHARTFTTNERNLICVFDVSFDEYNDDTDNTYLDSSRNKNIDDFIQHINDRSKS